MIISETNPPSKKYNRFVVTWERSLDPWHADSFPDGFKFVGNTGERKWGWLGLDWVGNPIIFIADGTELPD